MPISLSRALDDPNLFGPHFTGKSWAPWKVFLAALFAEAADEAAQAVYRERTGRTTWPTAPFTEAAVIVGRRGGKSRTLALIAVYLACFQGLWAVSSGGRGGDDWGAGGRQGTGAGDLPLRAWATEGGADAGAADRAPGQRDDRALQPGAYRDRHGAPFDRRAATPMRRSCATSSHSGARTRRPSTPMSKSCAHCGRVWCRSQARCW